MEQKKLIKLGALIAVGGGMFFAAQSLNQAPPPPPPPPAPVVVAAPVVDRVEKKFVLVATQDVPRGSRLRAEHLDWKSWPEDSLGASFITQQSRPQAQKNLVDSVVRSDIFAGEPIHDGKIVRAGDTGLMAALLAPGMRAVTTRVSVESAAGGFIMPGDKVDILHTVALPRQRQVGGTRQEATQYASNTIFENVKVLAINATFATGPDSPAAMQNVSYATFELSPDDAEGLEEAVKSGSISLVLRGLQPNGPARSAARMERVERSESSSLVIYRNGQQTQTAIRGQ